MVEREGRGTSGRGEGGRVGEGGKEKEELGGRRRRGRADGIGQVR